MEAPVTAVAVKKCDVLQISLFWLITFEISEVQLILRSCENRRGHYEIIGRLVTVGKDK